MAQTAVDRGHEMRQRLVRAAAGLIAEKGWSAVSTRMVAQRAGVAAGLVHYHFASVQALLAESAIGVIRALVAELAPLLAQARTPAEAVGLLLGSLEDFDGRDPTSLLFAETYLAATRDESLRRALGEVIRDFRSGLARRLADFGVPDADATAAVLAAAVDGVILHRALRPGLTAASVEPVLGRLLEVTPEGR
jgi:AcrR family transcriptional regulator